MNEFEGTRPLEQPARMSRRGVITSGVIVSLAAAAGVYEVGTNPQKVKELGNRVLDGLLAINPNTPPQIEPGAHPTATTAPATSSDKSEASVNFAPGESVGHVGAEIFNIIIPEPEKPLLQAITTLPVGSHERKNKEADVAKKASSHAEVRGAFLVTEDELSRQLLRTKFFDAMNRQDPGTPLTPKVKAWGHAHLVDASGKPYHDVGLTLLRKNYRATRKVLEALLPYYKQTNQVAKDATAATVMPTPGLAAVILGTESSMLSGIGTSAAIKQIDKKYETDLRSVIKRFEAQTGISYPVDNFPGNKVGALGPDQVMPFRAVEIYNDLQRAGIPITYNPMDVEQVYLPIAILLAKGGYKAGDAEAILNATKKWTRDTDGYGRKMTTADMSYRASFPEEVV